MDLSEVKKYSEYYVSERVLQTLHYTECCHHYGSIISLSASTVFFMHLFDLFLA